ncbi:hypothetical protein [Flavobacterium sp. LM4]|uniref:hypothetical protein n=1 Tax=Flavobacterium sp. LM4 TaxID=1938609 RepID=UPI0009930FE4|nr:hypothetical protein [Flavobacterium sp. LM4]OOV16651.1 hypothetical protein BXU10_21120 [Flavobacterium sp. LM4]
MPEKIRQEFNLLYKDKLIGTFLIESMDFPSTSGQIKLNTDTIEKEKELREYIKFSIESSEKVLCDDIAYGEFIDIEEFKHLSIINSLDWTLLSKDGEVTKILVPLFFSNNEMSFRFQ